MSKIDMARAVKEFQQSYKFIPEYTFKTRDLTIKERKEFNRIRFRNSIRDFTDFLKMYICLWFGIFFTILSLMYSVFLVVGH